MKIAVIIPSYKSAETLPGVIEKLPAELYENGGKAVIVHDCSPDNTGKVADELAKSRPWLEVVHHEKNRGLGGAIKTGLKHAYDTGYDVYPVVHSDGQYAPDYCVKVCQPILDGETLIAQGSRMKGGGALEGGMPYWGRYIPNKILTFFENLVVGTSMSEFHSGYMIFSRRLLELVPYEKLQNNYNFDGEMIMMAHLAGIKCGEVPIPTKYDEETSSLNPIPYGMNVLRMMWRYTIGHYRELLDHHTAENPELMKVIR